MIFTHKAKKIRVMFTPFRDGLQSSFGGKTRLRDIMPALEASAHAGIRHIEFGGGARFQAPMFYLGENPFETMEKMRDAVGPDTDLQILTRSVSGVTLTTQSIEALQLQGKLMAGAGTTWDRNFDYMNDVRNMINTGRPIVEAGMHHQACIALMGLPFESQGLGAGPAIARFQDHAEQVAQFAVEIGQTGLRPAQRGDGDVRQLREPVAEDAQSHGLPRSRVAEDLREAAFAQLVFDAPTEVLDHRIDIERLGRDLGAERVVLQAVSSPEFAVHSRGHFRSSLGR